MSGHWAVDAIPHRCKTPSDTEMLDHKEGEHWTCDECGQEWKLMVVDGGMREPDVHARYMRKVYR